jgi:protein-tyrosine phosphatase
MSDSGIFRVHEIGAAHFSIVMRPGRDDRLADDIARFKAVGIELLVSMLTPDEQDELGLLAEADSCAVCEIEYLSVPIQDLGIPGDLTAFEASIQTVKHALSHGRSVGVHCRQSIGRSGLFACAVLVAMGLPLEQALTMASRARGWSVPETSEQREWLAKNEERFQRLGGTANGRER